MNTLSSTLFLVSLGALAVSAQSTAAQYGQCGGVNWTGATLCPSGWTCVKSNDYYSQCLQGTATATATSSSTTRTSSSVQSTTTTRATTTTAVATTATPTGLTTVFPTPVASTSRSAPITVSAGQSYDGNMWRYDRNPKVCAEQDETGEEDTIFILEAGATLSNVFIGPAQAEGVHCRGTCTLNNVWWEDVCEDGATFKQSSGTSYVNGGGAKGASDKVFQHNGFGTVSIKNFFINNFGKLYRSCGNCSGNGAARHVIIDNIVATDGDVIAGINTNYGDTAIISNSCINGPDICDRFQGTTSGEPTKIGTGPDGTYCIATNIRTTC